MKLYTIVVFFVLISGSSFGQFFDDFSDGDFSNNPTWSGEVDTFQVDGSFMLQSQGDSTASDELYLATPNSMINTTVWQFLVRLDFQPSTTNKVRVFLVSDVNNLEGNLNGYFLQVGETGSNDSLDFYIKSGGTETKLGTGSKSCFTSSSSNNVRIRVSRDNSGNWTVESDCSGGFNFTSELALTNNTHTSTSWFGFFCDHTSTRWNKFFFDDVYVGGPIADTIDPTLTSAAATSATNVDVYFSEPVDLTTSETEANYTVNNGIGIPDVATRDLTDSTLVHLTFTTNQLSNGSSYTLTVCNVEDTASNSISPCGVTNFNYLNIVPATYRDVVINEIYADTNPAVGLPAVEFVELYNRSNKVFDLAGWTFKDASTTVGTLTSHLLNPGQYVILCPNADTAAMSGFGDVIGLTMGSLNNTSDQLGLRDSSGTLIDTVEYDVSWYGDPIKDDGGYTLELINPVDSCLAGMSNWTGCNDTIVGGTPGAQNSVFDNTPDNTPPSLVSVKITSNTTLNVCFDGPVDTSFASNINNHSASGPLGNPSSASPVGPSYICVNLTFATPFDTGTVYTLTISNASDCNGNVAGALVDSFELKAFSNPVYKDVVINEIYPDTSPSVGLPAVEFVEIYNRSNKLFDLNGWTFKDASTTVGTFPTYALNPGDHLILCEQPDSATMVQFGSVVILNMGSLNNSSDQLGLRDGNGNLVDTVQYDISWYGNPNKDDGGWTLELINPDDTCGAGAANWSASNDPSGGTPGTQNSVFDNTPDTQAPSLVSLTVTAADSLRVCFDESMELSFASNPANYDAGVLGTAQTATPIGPDYLCVDLFFSTPFDTGTVYTMNISNAADCKSNAAGILTGNFALAGAGAPGGIVITEIFPDADTNVTNMPNVEYIEIYNASASAIDLNGWEITDQGLGNGADINNASLLPGEYALLTSTGDADEFTAWPTIKIIGVSGFPTLNNGGDDLQLFNNTGVLIDKAYYTDEWHDDENKMGGGWSLEKVDATFPCMNSDNWKSSTDPDGGTPGEANSVAGTFSDIRAPGVDKVVVQDPLVLNVYFTDLMTLTGLDSVENYVINPGGITPAFAAPVGPCYEQVDLLLPSPLDTHVVYTLFVNSVSDCSGNPIGSANWDEFGIPGVPDSGDVIINEILFNPLTGGSDYVELYNISNKILDLSAMQIGEIYENTDSIYNADEIGTNQELLLPQSYVCLTRDKAFQVNAYQPIDVDAIFEMSSFPSYDDSEGEVVIFTDSGIVLDRFYYLDDYHFANLDDDDGVSLERLDFFRATQDESNWHSAASTVNFGTPGYKNSQTLNPNPQEGTVTLNPETFSPDSDGFDDVLGIDYEFPFVGNNARVTIYDDRGRVIKRVAENTLLPTEAGTFTWDGIDENGQKAPVGIYVVLFEVSNPNTGKVSRWKLSAVLAARF